MLNQTAFYSFSLYFRTFFGFLGGMIIAKLLGPALYGVRNAFSLSLEYTTSYSDLGTFTAMSREVPYNRAGKDLVKSERIVSSVFGVNFLFSVFIGAILVFASLFLRMISWQPMYVDFVFFLGLLIITTKVKTFYYYKLVIAVQISKN